MSFFGDMLWNRTISLSQKLSNAGDNFIFLKHQNRLAPQKGAPFRWTLDPRITNPPKLLGWHVWHVSFGHGSSEPSRPSFFIKSMVQHGSSRIISSGFLNLENIDFTQRHPSIFVVSKSNPWISYNFLIPAEGFGFSMGANDSQGIPNLHPESKYTSCSSWRMSRCNSDSPPPKQKVSTNPL